MAVNESRSMNQELAEGLTDGVVKKLAPNRSGFPNDLASAHMMASLLDGGLYDMSFATPGEIAALARRQSTVHG